VKPKGKLYPAACYRPLTSTDGETMPKPNYAFAKRQRELAKKAKKEEKQRAREAAKETPADTPPQDQTQKPDAETPGN